MKMSIVIMKDEQMSLAKFVQTGSFFCSKPHKRIIEIDWFDTIDFPLEKGYNVLNYTIV